MVLYSFKMLLSLVLLQLLQIVRAERELLVISVATDRTDGFKRFERSCQIYELPLRTLGMGQVWQGGDMNYPGGGWKVNLLKEETEKLKDKEDTLVMFTDSYDVVIAAKKEAILDQYDKFGANVVFGAENFCWPDASLKTKYPEIKTGMRFLNSGGFIGPASTIYQMLLDGGEIENTDDDQLFYTKIYLDEELKSKHMIKLDHKAELFQNLNGEQENIELRFAGNEPFVQNLVYNSMPKVIHGNGPSKLFLSTLGNYLAHSWNSEDGCLECWEDSLEFVELLEVPKVVLGIFIEKPTPFMEEFWEKLANLEYDKSNIDVFLHNTIEFHDEAVSKFVNNNTDLFSSIEIIGHEENLSEEEAREKALEKCEITKCDFLFIIDSDVHLDNSYTLRLLMEQKREVVAPMMIRPYTAWSNFWGYLSSDGFYARSFDYMEIVNSNRRGLWNVPFVSSCYLISGQLIRNPKTRPSFRHEELDPDMALAASIRSKDKFIFVSNRLDFGHLVNNEDFRTDKRTNELWELERNRYDWEIRYIHPNHSETINTALKDLAQPCPDVYWFPLFTDRFCDEFIAEAENYGKWSDGTNSDKRLQGGYEAVPTRDIHMNQIDFDEEWLYMLDFYVRPVQEHIFTGYFHNPPRSLMNFMVRYKPSEQPSLRPHHDSSTYTINVALNTRGKDYQGGGVRFVRYDCNVLDTKKGWVLIHPGRLTHYHEGLATTEGTRYIMISFVDP